MYIANVFYVVYCTTLVRTKKKMSKSENQERKKSVKENQIPKFQEQNLKNDLNMNKF